MAAILPFLTTKAITETAPQPGFLHGALSLADRAEHPMGHRPQTSPLRLEPLGQQLRSATRHISRSPVS